MTLESLDNNGLNQLAAELIMGWEWFQPKSMASGVAIEDDQGVDFEPTTVIHYAFILQEKLRRDCLDDAYAANLRRMAPIGQSRTTFVTYATPKQRTAAALLTAAVRVNDVHLQIINSPSPGPSLIITAGKRTIKMRIPYCDAVDYHERFFQHATVIWTDGDYLPGIQHIQTDSLTPA